MTKFAIITVFAECPEEGIPGEWFSSLPSDAVFSSALCDDGTRLKAIEMHIKYAGPEIQAQAILRKELRG